MKRKIFVDYRLQDPPTGVDFAPGRKAPDEPACRMTENAEDGGSQRKIFLAFDTFFSGIPSDLKCRTQRAEPTSVSQSGSSLPGNEDYLPQQSGCRN
jgi:hypothetical protein